MQHKTGKVQKEIEQSVKAWNLFEPKTVKSASVEQIIRGGTTTEYWFSRLTIQTGKTQNVDWNNDWAMHSTAWATRQHTCFVFLALLPLYFKPNIMPFCLDSEFLPYVFQVLSLLLEIQQNIPAPYMELFPLLLSPVLWERNGMFTSAGNFNR